MPDAKGGVERESRQVQLPRASSAAAAAGLRKVLRETRTFSSAKYPAASATLTGRYSAEVAGPPTPKLRVA